MSRLAVIAAQAQGFATSFVVVSDNDLHFERFDDVYRKVVQELSTSRLELRQMSLNRGQANLRCLGGSPL